MARIQISDEFLNVFFDDFHLWTEEPPQNAGEILVKKPIFVWIDFGNLEEEIIMWTIFEFY